MTDRVESLDKNWKAIIKIFQLAIINMFKTNKKYILKEIENTSKKIKDIKKNQI